MKTIMIDFAPRSLTRELQRTSTLIWCLLFAALLCWTAIGYKAFSLIKQRDRVAAMLQQVTGQVQSQLDERAEKKRVASSFTIPEAQALAVNNAIAQLNLPWRDLFDALESATPASIALIAIEPDAKKRVLKGIAEAKTSDEMIAYIELLKKQPTFSKVLLAKHEINELDPNKPVRFYFDAEWVEAGL